MMKPIEIINLDELKESIYDYLSESPLYSLQIVNYDTKDNRVTAQICMHKIFLGDNYDRRSSSQEEIL